MLDNLLSRAERDTFLLLKGARQRLRGERPRLTVFVAGVQRSGTNMMMDVLERSPDTVVYHERDPRAFANYQMRPWPEIHSLRDRAKASHFVIKSLCELQHRSALMEEFAPAKAIWMVRDYNDVVNSMRKSFRNQAKQVRRLVLDRKSDGWLGDGMSDETHRLLNDLVDEEIDDASAAALIWYFRNVLYFEQGLGNDERVRLVPYEQLVQYPGEIFADIFSFLELPFKPSYSRRVHASSVKRRLQPAVREAVRHVCEGLTGRFNDHH